MDESPKDFWAKLRQASDAMKVVLVSGSPTGICQWAAKRNATEDGISSTFDDDAIAESVLSEMRKDDAVPMGFESYITDAVKRAVEICEYVAAQKEQER